MKVGNASCVVSHTKVEACVQGEGPFDLDPVRRLLSDHAAPDAVRNAVIDDLALTIPPGVFSPLLTKTSRFFASFIAPRSGDNVLDIFTGTGYLGLLAARRCHRVVCVDHSPAAMECARLNADKNGVADIVEVRCGDVFDAVGTRSVSTSSSPIHRFCPAVRHPRSRRRCSTRASARPSASPTVSPAI